jgi:hypothetical protein
MVENGQLSIGAVITEVVAVEARSRADWQGKNTVLNTASVQAGAANAAAVVVDEARSAHIDLRA